jgi:hypothetical protein
MVGWRGFLRSLTTIAPELPPTVYRYPETGLKAEISALACCPAKFKVPPTPMTGGVTKEKESVKWRNHHLIRSSGENDWRGAKRTLRNDF